MGMCIRYEIQIMRSFCRLNTVLLKTCIYIYTKLGLNKKPAIVQNTGHWTHPHSLIIGRKTVWFSLLPLQLNGNCLFLTSCSVDLQHEHCFSKYGANGITISYDLHAPEQTGTLVLLGSQPGHSMEILFLCLVQSSSGTVQSLSHKDSTTRSSTPRVVNIFVLPYTVTSALSTAKNRLRGRAFLRNCWHRISTLSWAMLSHCTNTVSQVNYKLSTS